MSESKKSLDDVLNEELGKFFALILGIMGLILYFPVGILNFIFRQAMFPRINKQGRIVQNKFLTVFFNTVLVLGICSNL
jgi:hypothetical protein